MQEQELIKWDDSLLTNINIIDAQHKYFISILNKLYLSYEGLKGKEEIDPLIIDLKNYAGVHFKTEEGLMEKYNYNGLNDHKIVHTQMAHKLNELIESYYTDGKKTLPSLFDFLEDWLVKHLDMYDSKYAIYFKQINIPELNQ